MRADEHEPREEASSFERKTFTLDHPCLWRVHSQLPYVRMGAHTLVLTGHPFLRCGSTPEIRKTNYPNRENPYQSLACSNRKRRADCRNIPIYPFNPIRLTVPRSFALWRIVGDVSRVLVLVFVWSCVFCLFVWENRS
jgi:hypothetical protein